MNKTNKKECFILGTRPTVIKFAPLILKMKPFIIHTGQHSELADDMFKIFNIKPDVSLNLMTENQSLVSFISKSLYELDKIMQEKKFERIWVHGDTSSGLVGALVGSIYQIPVIHHEAGLRTFDKQNPFPEEIFRTLIDNVSDILFAPTERAKKNLINENTKGKIFVTGNLIVDALEMIKKKLPKNRPIKEKYVLATIHRRESFGQDMYEIFSALKELSKENKVILPAHPNPNVQKTIKKVGLDVVEPMNYLDFLWYLKFSEYVITDSGGVQEEAPSFQKKAIILRKTTERQELIENGYGVLIKELKKDVILKTIKEFIKKDINFKGNPFGRGDTSDKIIQIMKTQY